MGGWREPPLEDLVSRRRRALPPAPAPPPGPWFGLSCYGADDAVFEEGLGAPVPDAAPPPPPPPPPPPRCGLDDDSDSADSAGALVRPDATAS